MYVSAMSVKVREGKNAGTSCEKTSHGRFQQISGENRPRERVSRQISAKNGRESNERARLTAGTGQILAYYGQKKTAGFQPIMGEI